MTTGLTGDDGPSEIPPTPEMAKENGAPAQSESISAASPAGRSTGHAATAGAGLPEPAPAGLAKLISAERLAPVWKILAGLLGRNTGFDLALSDEEAAILGEATAPVLLKYLPATSRFEEETALLLCAGVIFGGKIHEQRNRGNIRPEGDGEKQPESATSHPNPP